MAYRIMLATITARDAAEQLAQTLLQEQLVACVNIIASMTSLYRWQGAVERDEEYLLVMKTTAAHEVALITRLDVLHPHEVPEVVVVPVATGSQAHVSWITSSVQQGD